MNNASTLERRDAPEFHSAAVQTLDITREITAETRGGGLRLVSTTKTPGYWQTESRDEALKRAISCTG